MSTPGARRSEPDDPPPEASGCGRWLAKLGVGVFVFGASCGGFSYFRIKRSMQYWGDRYDPSAPGMTVGEIVFHSPYIVGACALLGVLVAAFYDPVGGTDEPEG